MAFQHEPDNRLVAIDTLLTHIARYSRLQRRVLLGNVNHEALTLNQRKKMLAANPFIAAVHYENRRRSIWKHILNGRTKPLGVIIDWWRRTDAQHNCSLHDHLLLAIEELANLPEWLLHEDHWHKAEEYVRKRITAWLPESPPDGFNDAGLRIETSPGTRKSSSHASNIITDMHVNAGNDADQIDTHDHAGVRSNEMSP